MSGNVPDPSATPAPDAAAGMAGAEDLAAAVADGRDVDWTLRAPADPSVEGPGLVGELQVLQAIERFHREHVTLHERPGAFVRELPCAWGHLTLVDIIGRGAFGIVYRAHDERLSRDVALKLVADEEVGRAGEDLLYEARCLARVKHPNVVAVYGAERREGTVGIWMELIEGPTLEEYIQAVGTLSAVAAALFLQQVCAGLAAVHRAGLLHRDVKAQNVIHETGGRLVLMDLGSGLWDQERTADVPVERAGTPLYMAPEVLKGEAPTPASDIYSLGMLAFRLVSGRFAVDGATVEDLRRAHAAASRVRLQDLRSDLSGAFLRIVERAMHPDPGRRFASAADMGAALRAFATAGGDFAIQAPPDVPQPAAGPAPPWWRRAFAARVPLWIPVAIAAAAIVGALAGRDGSPRHDAPPAANPAAVARRAPVSPGYGPEPQLTEGQSRLLWGLHDAAMLFALAGKWDESLPTFREVERLLAQHYGQRSVLVASATVRRARAEHLTGHVENACAAYEVGVELLEDLAGRDHPETIAALMGLAAANQTRGHHQLAAIQVADAMTRWSALVRRWSGEVPARTPLSPEHLEALSPLNSLSVDRDGDWLPDLVDAALGFRPDLADTDGDGVSDSEEPGRDGLAAGVDGAIPWDPVFFVAQGGAIPPEHFGFLPEPGVVGQTGGSAAPGAARAVGADHRGAFARRLSPAMATAIERSGFRLAVLGAPSSGTLSFGLDLGGRVGQWVLAATREDGSGHHRLFAPRSLVPWLATEVPVGPASRLPLIELRVDPALGTEVLALGRRLPAKAAPLTQSATGRGLYFGVDDRPVAADHPSADFAFVILQLRRPTPF